MNHNYKYIYRKINIHTISYKHNNYKDKVLIKKKTFFLITGLLACDSIQKVWKQEELKIFFHRALSLDNEQWYILLLICSMYIYYSSFKIIVNKIQICWDCLIPAKKWPSQVLCICYSFFFGLLFYINQVKEYFVFSISSLLSKLYSLKSWCWSKRVCTDIDLQFF